MVMTLWSGLAILWDFSNHTCTETFLINTSSWCVWKRWEMCWTYHDAWGRSDDWEILWTSCPGLAMFENFVAFTTAAAVVLPQWFVVPFSWYSCCIVFACFRMKRKTKLLTAQRNWCEQLTTDLRWGVWTAFVCYEFAPFVHICVRLLVIPSVTKSKCVCGEIHWNYCVQVSLSHGFFIFYWQWHINYYLRSVCMYLWILV